MGDSSGSSVTSTCWSSTAESIAPPRTPLPLDDKKFDAFNDVLRRLRDLNLPETADSAFEDELWAHFYTLSPGYAVEINMDKVENVLVHKRILEEARNPASINPAIEVQLVQFSPSSVNQKFTGKESIQDTTNPPQNRLMHEITISTKDHKMLVTWLATLISEVVLNIYEAHVFSTNDCYCLGLFKVEYKLNEDAKQLKNDLLEEMSKVEKYPWLMYVKNQSKQSVPKLECSTKQSLRVPYRENDPNLLASGSDSDLRSLEEEISKV